MFVIEETPLIENLSMPERIGPSFKSKGVIYPEEQSVPQGEGLVVFSFGHTFPVLAQSVLNLVELFQMKVQTAQKQPLNTNAPKIK